MHLTPDQLADRCAGRQHGLITRRQARSFGLTDRQIQYRVALKRWLGVAPGVYRVASAPTSWQQKALAACLAGPCGTMASHLTAAALHGLGVPSHTPHVIVPRTASARLQIAIVHHARLDPSHSRAVVAGVPCTNVTRTLVDCADIVGFERVCAMVDAAFCGGLSHPIALRTAIDRGHWRLGKRGTPPLLAALEAWTPEIRPGSPAEVRLFRQLREWGCPEPASQVEVFGRAEELVGRLDVAWVERRLGLEYDSDRWHNPRRWPHDEARQKQYEALGWFVRRVDKFDLRAGAGELRTVLLGVLGKPAA